MAMKTDAEKTPYNNLDPEDQSASTKEGRGALRDWLAYGFVTPNFTRSISRTVEYSLNDFALSQVTKGEAPNDVEKYLNRSAYVPAPPRVDSPQINVTDNLLVAGNVSGITTLRL